MRHGRVDRRGGPDTALVMFSGQTDLRWLGILKPGFRHCFVVVGRRRRWVAVDPLCHWTEISVLDDAELWELITLYCAQGLTVLPWTIVLAPLQPAPIGLYTCVEAVKRILGIHASRVITPWNLYRFLVEKNMAIVYVRKQPS